MTAPCFILPGWCLGRGPLLATAQGLQADFIDLPGYGESPLIADFDAAIAAIGEKLPTGAQLIGWSLGAQMALALAARFPNKISKLVLIAGTVSFVQRDGWPHGMPPPMLAEFATAIAADAEAMLPRFVGGFNRGDARAKAVTADLLAQADPRPTVEVLCTGLDWLRDVDLRPDCQRIQCPTLLIQGAADPLMPLAAGQALAALIPGSQLAVFDDCAHAPFTSRPDDCLTSLRNFLHD